PRQRTKGSRRDALRIVHTDNLWGQFTPEDNGNGDENGEKPQPAIAERRSEDRTRKGRETRVGERVENKDGGDGPLDILFQRQPAGRTFDAAGALELQRQRIETQQHRLREGANERDDAGEQ